MYFSNHNCLVSSSYTMLEELLVIKLMGGIHGFKVMEWHKLRMSLSSESRYSGKLLIIVSRAGTLYTSFILPATIFITYISNKWKVSSSWDVVDRSVCYNCARFYQKLQEREPLGLRLRASFKAEECADNSITRWNLYSISTSCSYWLFERYSF